jgi:hypothetical protein
MKIFFASYDLFVQMFTPLVGMELEMNINGRIEKVRINGFVNGAYAFALYDTEKIRIVELCNVWEIHVP